jgi:hypothetical protein
MTTEVLSRRVDLTLTAVGVVALGSLATLVAFPSGPSGPVLLAFVASALLVLAGTELATDATVRSVGAFLLVSLSLTAMTWVLSTVVETLATTMVLLAGGIALCSYGLHRYELVALGLVGDPDEL